MPTLLTTRRNTMLCTLALCMPASLLAIQQTVGSTESTSPPDGALFVKLQRLVRPALLDMNAGRVQLAMSGLEQARAILAESEIRNWPFWFYVNQPYGLALIRLGRAQEAIAPLEIAVNTERRMRASSSSQIRALISGLDQGIVKELLRVEFTRQAASNMETSGPQPRTIKELLLDQSTGTMDATELLVRAYGINGDFASAAALLEPQILDAKGPHADKDLPPVALEYRLMKMGAALSSLGDKANATRALNAAMALNFYRLRTVGEYVAQPEIQSAIYNVRRLMLSAALGNFDFADLSTSQSLELVMRVVETKGLGVRYAERFNRLLGLSSSPQAVEARRRLLEIESSMAELPDSQTGAMQFFMLAAERAEVVAPVMQELRAGGIGEVFQDGATLLAQARAVLGNDAIIGYMAYTPLAANKYAFGSPRYLRYCITGSEIQLTDLGAKSVIDKAVFSWRQRVLSGLSASELASELTSRLLTDLPNTVKRASKWTVEPDGALNLLPFEALSAPDGRPLVSTVDIGYVTSFGQIATPPAARRSGKARIIADPDFGSSSVDGQNRRFVTKANAKVVQKGRAFESMNIAQLPETRIEARAVEKALLQVGVASETFLGSRANIEAFNLPESPRILHVATHGILIEPHSFPELLNVDPLSQAEAVTISMPGRNAGLAVAGHGKPEVIYAIDIACLPLQSTELVVLSACDTGNGTVDVGEGMASLRRAIEAAGAHSSITSLWSVPSSKTTELMAGFYGHLAGGKSKRAALRHAKLDAIASDPNPYNWAGFVFAGRE